ncbi:MAG: ribonuclease R [Alphaproteobacteria bacterium]|nr:ribonuclease R [Alphaproteobacteria bacterium]
MAKSKPIAGAGKSRSARADRLPSRDEIAAYVKDSHGKVSKREIARAFGITGAGRAALKEMMRDLVADGTLAGGGKRRLADPSRLPPVLVVEVTGLDADGDPLAAPSDWRGEGRAPRIALPSTGGRPGPALGLGDRALVKVRATGPGHYEGRIIRALSERPGRAVGVFREAADGGRIQVVDRRARSELAVSADDTMAAVAGELVVAEIGGPRRFGLPRAKVVERLGGLDSAHAISTLLCSANGIPTRFPAAALAQADAARAPDPDGRTDLRALALVTIDDEDARDFDDAVWAEADPDPANSGGWHAVVAIADVGHYVCPGDPIDREARSRGNSVYFPDRVVPMLPEPLSNGWCSLKAGEDRACLAVHLWIDRDGTRRRHRIERALMRSAGRLTYAGVQAAHDGLGDAGTAELGPVIAALYGVYRSLARARVARGTLDLDLPERRVVLAEDGQVQAIETRLRRDSHRLIEEMMIAANVAVAEVLSAKAAPCMYRVHDQPPLDKLEPLRTFLASLGYKLSRARHLTPGHFNQILLKAAGRPEEEVVKLVILRAQAQAEYNPRNIGHFGLNLHRYAHFTSPIRRYADLLVHRSLIRRLELGGGGIEDGTEDDWSEIGATISAAERRAAAAERDAFDRYATRLLAARIGAEFGAHITGVTRFGLFVAIDETGAEGLIPIRDLGAASGEYFRLDDVHHRLVGDETGISHGLGAPIRVRLAEADVVTGSIRFELAAQPEIARKSRRRRRR